MKHSFRSFARLLRRRGVQLGLAALFSWSTPSVAKPVEAVAARRFLGSIGINSTFPNRGQPLAKTIQMLRYCGFRWVRGGIEGLTDVGPTTLQTFMDLHHETGVKLSWGLGSGGANLKKLIETGRILAEHDALLAFEGNNEPNNWAVFYQGERGGGREVSWMPIAKIQRDLYTAVKSDPVLARYPVWSISEPGGQRENVGLQYLTIPAGARTAMPDETQYADYANVHNYIYHQNALQTTSNKVWDASDPTSNSHVDGLFFNYGITWSMRFRGYPENELAHLPRVTTETGVALDGDVTEEMQGRFLVNLYLAQFKRGYSHTSVYLLRDRTDEDGNQTYGFFRPDYSARPAAKYLHNFTRILDDQADATKPASLDYDVSSESDAVHDLLLRHSDGTFKLVIWGERLRGEERVTVRWKGQPLAAKTYDPMVGTGEMHLSSPVNELTLAISDHPVIISLDKVAH